MDSITIGKRKLGLQEPTLGFVLKVESKRFRQLLSADGQSIDPDDDAAIESAVNKASENWEAFCRTIFRRSWVWRLTGFPRWLKYTNLRISEIEEVLKSFFSFYTAAKKQQGGSQTSADIEHPSAPPNSPKATTQST